MIIVRFLKKKTKKTLIVNGIPIDITNSVLHPNLQTEGFFSRIIEEMSQHRCQEIIFQGSNNGIPLSHEFEDFCRNNNINITIISAENFERKVTEIFQL